MSLVLQLKEYAIQQKVSSPLSFKIQQMPLSITVQDYMTFSGLAFTKKNHAKRGYTESLKTIENQEKQRKKGRSPTVLGRSPRVLERSHTVLGRSPTVLGRSPTVL